VTTLFTAVLRAIESRTRTELETRFPGRFRDKGTQGRQWQLPFGLVRFALMKLWDPVARRTVYPRKEAMELPKHVRWCEETLVPGYRLAVLQSFRQSQKAVRGLAPDGRAPSHATVHRRFQGFAATLDPVPDSTHRPGPKPAAYQQADGTKLKLQAQGHRAGSADLRLVVGSRSPHGPLEVLDFSVGDAWETIAQRLRQRFPKPPKVLVSDGEEGIPEALAGPDTLHQRCLVHGRRNLPFALYQDGYVKADRTRIEQAFARIPGLQLCQAELARVDPTDKATLRELLEASEQAFLALKRQLPEIDFPLPAPTSWASSRTGWPTSATSWRPARPSRSPRTGWRASGAGCSCASSRSAAGGPYPGRSTCWRLVSCTPSTRSATRRLRRPFGESTSPSSRS
jgi:hypothetical protein